MLGMSLERGTVEGTVVRESEGCCSDFVAARNKLVEFSVRGLGWGSITEWKKKRGCGFRLLCEVGIGTIKQEEEACLVGVGNERFLILRCWGFP